MKASGLFPPDDLLQEILLGYVKIQVHPEFPDLHILNYSAKAQYENWWNDVTEQCRGLIYSAETGEVIARPFRKFFNWGQLDRDMLPSGPIRVQDKMDGSLGILYAEPSTGRLAIATRGSFTSDQALHATKVLRTRYEDFAPLAGVTYLFEIIYPENRIVVDYGSMDDLVLLDIISIDSGASLIDLFAFRSTWPGPVVERFEYPFIADVLSTPPRAGKEGFVVTYENGFRLKVKYEEYVRLHRLLTGVSSKTIWEILSTRGDLLEILDRVPDEYYAWVQDTAHGLLTEFNGVRQDAVFAYTDVMNKMPKYAQELTTEDGQQTIVEEWTDRAGKKWFAEQVKGHEHKGLLFALYDDMDISKAIWKLVKPEYSKPFWAQSEDAA